MSEAAGIAAATALWLVATVAGSAALAQPVGHAPSSGASLSPERQTELRYLLRHDCGACHGMTLRGGLGPSLLPTSLAGKPAAALVTAVLDGRPGTPMPPWRGLLSEAEVRWLVGVLLAPTAEVTR